MDLLCCLCALNFMVIQCRNECLCLLMWDVGCPLDRLALAFEMLRAWCCWTRDWTLDGRVGASMHPTASQFRACSHAHSAIAYYFMGFSCLVVLDRGTGTNCRARIEIGAGKTCIPPIHPTSTYEYTCGTRVVIASYPIIRRIWT